MPALKISVEFAGENDPAQDEWMQDFSTLTGINPEDDPEAIEQWVEDKWTLSFTVYTPEGKVYNATQDVLLDAKKRIIERIQGKIKPMPHSTRGWDILDTRKVTASQAAVMAEELVGPDASQEEKEQAIQEIQEVTVVQKDTSRPQRKRLGPTRPTRTRNLGKPKEWETYILPGHTIPYWEEMNLHRAVGPGGGLNVVDQDTWRQVYRTWYRTTEKRKRAQREYNRDKLGGRARQKEWEKTPKGKAKRQEYFESDKGIAARKASQARSKLRLKLGKAFRDPNFTPQSFGDAYNKITGHSWSDVIINARERFGIDMHDDDIERVFWEQGLRPQMGKTEEEFLFKLGQMDSTRINPATGEELI